MVTCSYFFPKMGKVEVCACKNAGSSSSEKRARKRIGTKLFSEIVPLVVGWGRMFTK